MIIGRVLEVILFCHHIGDLTISYIGEERISVLSKYLIKKIKIGTIVESFQTYKKYLNSEFPVRSDLSPEFLLVKALLGLISLIYFWTAICLKQESALRIYHKLIEVDKLTSQDLKHATYNSLKKIVIIYCSINLFLWISIMISDMLALDSLFKSTWLIMGLPRFIESWFMIQYGLMANLQKNRFKEVNNSFRNLAGNFMVSVLDEKIILEDFRRFKHLYNQLYEMTIEISSYFSFLTFIIITYFCGTIVYTTYYLFSPFIHDIKNYTYFFTINSTLYLCMEMFPIVVLCVNISALTNEIPGINTVIYNIMDRCMDNTEVLLEMELVDTMVYKLMNRSVDCNELLAQV
ncbi:hypothetical protein KQX54_015763 [Cotesia glomerata]|uniref:Gustatory receptor n=1 Tax=Cotesia glomerata TaxID=32391 RepID=A0AAV7IR75_COTGL|nr:hypothetical protein KQX54_015763 [Cotesia glomerata]